MSPNKSDFTLQLMRLYFYGEIKSNLMIIPLHVITNIISHVFPPMYKNIIFIYLSILYAEILYYTHVSQQLCAERVMDSG